jgi:hypothetical protein
MKRAITGVVAAGLPVSRIEIDPNGKIVILTGLKNQTQGDGEWDDLE